MRIGPADPVVNFKKQSYFLLRCRDFYIKLIRAAAGYKCLEGFDLTVRDVYVSAGAGFVVALTGAIMTMPGLPKKPAADSIDVNEAGIITGLF